MTEASQFFEGKGSVQMTLRKITKRLDDLGIPYVVVGGLALFEHGFRRFTEDVDLLVSATSLHRIHQELDGLGYVPPFTGSKHLRDTESGVRIEFLIEGQFPGDGKPKPVAFPNPQLVAEERDGIKYLQLPRLVELKLASGMSNSQRLKDLSDVVEVIKLLGLPPGFEAQLNPYVRDKYRELWASVHKGETRYMRLWRNKFLTIDAESLDDMIAALDKASATLKAMRDDGVTLDPEGGTGDDYAHLITTDPAIAKKYDMHEESEFWGDVDDDDHKDDAESDGVEPPHKSDATE